MSEAREKYYMKMNNEFIVVDKITAKNYSDEIEQQKEELIEALSDERDKLYNNLPSGDIKAWDLLIVIKNHIANIDELLRKHTEDERDDKRTGIEK